MMETQPMLGGNGFAVSRSLNPNLVRVETLKPLGRETRKHPPAQIRKLQASIEQFGFVLPIVNRCDQPCDRGLGIGACRQKARLAGRNRSLEGSRVLRAQLHDLDVRRAWTGEQKYRL